MTKQENILVLKKEKFFKENYWQGIKPLTNYQEITNLIETEKEFLPRNLMEEDFRYKQVIPYLVFKNQNTYFLMQRSSNSTEQRLKNKFSLGIGGHMIEEDMLHKTIEDWAKREFNEEIFYNGDYSVKYLGILNDDSNPVSQVHIGLVLLLDGTTPDIKIKSELKSGQLLTLNQCADYYDAMESWSQIVYDHLVKNQ